MPADLQLQVPRSAWPDFQALLELPLATVERLCSFTSAAAPVPDVEDLVELFQRQIPVASADATSFVTLLINLKRLQHSVSQPAATVLDGIAQALQRSGISGWEEKYAAAWQERRPLLEPLLSSENAIFTMAKVRTLLFESQCVLQESMVLTDVRPVFSEAGDRILGGLVLHTLSLSYSEGGEAKQLHVTLTAEEVANLINQLKRDQRKAATAADLLTRQQVPELTPRRNLQT